MQHLSPHAAHAFLLKHRDAVLIDVRPDLECLLVGAPLDSLCIPWADDTGRVDRAAFLARVREAAGSGERPLVLICRTGRRSVQAGRCLEEAGFRQVYDVAHGFEGELDSRKRRSSRNGWRFENLPWVQC